MADAKIAMRYAVPADGERIAQYHYACWLQAFAPLVSDEVMEVVEPRVERWQSWLAADSDLTTVVAINADDEPIGHATVSGSELVHLFIDPAHHRSGLGRELLAVGERLIRQAGYAQAQLHTIVGNTPAIALYQSCGWIVTDRTEDDVMSNGATYTEHVLTKDLADWSHVEANRETWDDDAGNWLERGRRSWAAAPHWGEMGVLESEVGALPELKGRDVVELGCGTGYVSAWCLRAGAASAVGVDNSRAQLRSAQVLQAEFDLTFPLVWANAEQTPLPDNSFDVAINEYGAALWCDPYCWIPEAARLLRPGGSLMFLTCSTLMGMCAPNFEHEPTSTQLIRSPHNGDGRVVFPDTDGVQFLLSHGEWIALLRENSFVIDRLIELYAPDDAPDRYSYFDGSWAQQWPPEEMWCATYQGGQRDS